MKKLVSIIVPVFNEEKVIDLLCKRLTSLTKSIKNYNFEVIMVENGSFDNSFNLLKKARDNNSQIKIVQIVKNVGTDGALIAGLTYAKGDAAVVMMADLQDVPELIPVFLDKWEKGYDIIYGIVTKRDKVKLTRRFGTFVFYKIIKLITNNLVVENASDFRLMDRKVYKLVISMPEHNKFFRGLVSWTGFKQVGIPFDRPPRAAGESKAYFSTVLKVGMNGIFSFSSFPIYVPVIFSVILFIIALYTLFLRDYSLTLQLCIYACIFIVLSIILEYIRRIFVEVQNRPYYIIRQTIGIE